MSQILNTGVRWTIHDVERFSENEGVRYEIVDGELFVTRAPHFKHQTKARLKELADESDT